MLTCLFVVILCYKSSIILSQDKYCHLLTIIKIAFNNRKLSVQLLIIKKIIMNLLGPGVCVLQRGLKILSRLTKRKKSLTIKENIKLITTSTQTCVKVTVCGASGGIGQPLSLLLKESPLVSELSLYDIVHSIGVAADLAHIDTDSKVTGYIGLDQLKDSLRGSQVILVCAGVARKPGMTRDDLFDINASTVKDIVEVVAEVTPQGFLGIITNPVNSTVPIAAEILKKVGVFDPKKLFGITTLDIVRTNTFIGQAKGLDPKMLNVPVIGGHSGVTIIPLISQAIPAVSFSKEEIKAITVRIQEAGTEVVKAKAGNGSATLSMAYSAARFVFQLCRALNGEPNIVECSFVQSDVAGTKYFSNPVLLGVNGLQKNLGLGKLSEYEHQLLKAAIPELKKNIQKGEDYVLKK